jgi:hypothetical protein
MFKKFHEVIHFVANEFTYIIGVPRGFYRIENALKIKGE